MMWKRLRGYLSRLATAVGSCHEDARKSLISVLVVAAVSVMAAPPQATAKPTFPFALSLAGLVGARNDAGPFSVPPVARTGEKPYSGLRRKNDSLMMIYYHDQTVAVVELGPKKLLLNCELIEVREDDNRQRLLQDLSKINRPLEITFKQMMKLMWQCQQVENVNWQSQQRWTSQISAGSKRNEGRINARSTASREPERHSGNGGRIGGLRPGVSVPLENEETLSGGLLDSGPFSLLSGIIPGTKWCGTGDIANNYHDLGKDRRMDRCCRTHDLCPTKVRAFSSRYNLTNKSLYSKSHCVCDDMLFSCLKKTNTSAAQVMGSIYFNLVQVPCLEYSLDGELRFRRAKEGF